MGLDIMNRRDLTFFGYLANAWRSGSSLNTLYSDRGYPGLGLRVNPGRIRVPLPRNRVHDAPINRVARSILGDLQGNLANVRPVEDPISVLARGGWVENLPRPRNAIV